MQWTVLIPAKALPGAKSRLVPASSDAEAHRRLVEAIRADTIAAALAARGVARVVLVTDRPLTGLPSAVPDALVLVQRSPGLNAALREGAAHAVREWPEDGVAALVGDLPALRPAELAAALAGAADHGVAFVADADGTGTTFLAAAPGHRLEPMFGPGSAARHAIAARPLDAGAGLRRDVDTAEDLDRAVDVGLGAATSGELAAAGITRRSPCGGIVGP